MDFDDYYSLTEYASRFTSDADRYITLWFSQISVLTRIQLWERENNSELFRDSLIELYVSRLENDELLDIEEVSKELSLESIFVEDGNVFAFRDIYYDFVGFLLSVGVVK